MAKKIIAYEAPFDLFGGTIEQGTHYKPVASHNNTVYAATHPDGIPIDSGKTNLPKEIVEQWVPVYSIEYQSGDYVVSLCNCANRSVGDVFKVLSVEPNRIYYREDTHGRPEGFRLATEDEIKIYEIDLLIKEAKERYPIGTRFIGAHVPHKKNDVSIVTTNMFIKASRQSDGVSIYALTDSRRYYDSDSKYGNTANDRIVYFEGRWAEIVGYPLITVNGYIGEFQKDNIVFGCAKIHKQLFLELFAIKDSTWTNGKEIESVTIGRGTFSKSQIKEIAEYYLNKDEIQRT